MKIIFIEDVKGQGRKGEIKEVKAGYAYNYLFKNNYAVPLTNANLNRLKEEKEIKNKKENEELNYFKELKQKLKLEKLGFKVKTGSKDKLFGSISSKQISVKLKNLGYEIDRKKIILPKALTKLGTHQIKLLLHKQVTANLEIELIKE